ncbi:hypothetical protein MMC13_007558 [Lambiella insularis]|nr:hypothetical protein [Lambiella insularis]
MSECPTITVLASPTSAASFASQDHSIFLTVPAIAGTIVALVFLAALIAGAAILILLRSRRRWRQSTSGQLELDSEAVVYEADGKYRMDDTAHRAEADSRYRYSRLKLNPQLVGQNCELYGETILGGRSIALPSELHGSDAAMEMDSCKFYQNLPSDSLPIESHRRVTGGTWRESSRPATRVASLTNEFIAKSASRNLDAYHRAEGTNRASGPFEMPFSTSERMGSYNPRRLIPTSRFNASVSDQNPLAGDNHATTAARSRQLFHQGSDLSLQFQPSKAASTTRDIKAATAANHRPAPIAEDLRPQNEMSFSKLMEPNLFMWTGETRSQPSSAVSIEQVSHRMNKSFDKSVKQPAPALFRPLSKRASSIPAQSLIPSFAHSIHMRPQPFKWPIDDVPRGTAALQVDFGQSGDTQSALIDSTQSPDPLLLAPKYSNDFYQPSANSAFAVPQSIMSPSSAGLSARSGEHSL